MLHDLFQLNVNLFINTFIDTVSSVYRDYQFGVDTKYISLGLVILNTDSLK